MQTKAKLKYRELNIFQVWLSRSLPITSLIWHCIQRANSIFQSELSANSTSITTLCASTTSLVRLLWQCLQSKTRLFSPASTSPSRPSRRIKEWRQQILPAISQTTQSSGFVAISKGTQISQEVCLRLE